MRVVHDLRRHEATKQIVEGMVPTGRPTGRAGGAGGARGTMAAGGCLFSIHRRQAAPAVMPAKIESYHDILPILLAARSSIQQLASLLYELPGPTVRRHARPGGRVLKAQRRTQGTTVELRRPT